MEIRICFKQCSYVLSFGYKTCWWDSRYFITLVKEDVYCYQVMYATILWHSPF